MTKEEAMQLLECSGVFYPSEDDDGVLYRDKNGCLVLNQNDTWGWATAFGQPVPEDKLIEVAELFWAYGYPGILYWVTDVLPMLKQQGFYGRLPSKPLPLQGHQCSLCTNPLLDAIDTCRPDILYQETHY